MPNARWSEGEEFSALVRMRSLETLKDAGSRAAGLRVLVGQRVGSSYTSDLSAEGIRKMVDSAHRDCGHIHRGSACRPA